MKSVKILAAICVLGSVASVRAEFHDFEDLPSTYWSDNGGGTTDIGGYYANVTFSAGVQGYNNISGYPTHSPSIGLIQTGFSTDEIDFSISNLKVGNVSFWYNTLLGITATAFDSHGNVVASYTGPANTDGASGSPSIASLSGTGLAQGDYIDHVTITDGLGIGGFFTVDDVNLDVPDATSTLGLLGLAATGMIAFRRKVVA